MSIGDILPFKDRIIAGKLINDELAYFIYKASDDNEVDLCAVLVKRGVDDDAVIGKVLEFSIPESSNYAVWSDEEGNELLFAYTPKVPVIVEGEPQKDQGVLMRHKDGNINDSLTINFDRKSGSLNVDLMWQMRHGPKNIKNTDIGDTTGMSEKDIARAKAAAIEPEKVYGKNGGLKGIRTGDGKFHRIDIPYSERKQYH